MAGSSNSSGKKDKSGSGSRHHHHGHRGHHGDHGYSQHGGMDYIGGSSTSTFTTRTTTAGQEGKVDKSKWRWDCV